MRIGVAAGKGRPKVSKGVQSVLPLGHHRPTQRAACLCFVGPRDMGGKTNDVTGTRMVMVDGTGQTAVGECTGAQFRSPARSTAAGVFREKRLC